MREVLNEILAAEQKAEKLLAEARMEAQNLRQKVEQEFGAKLAEAKQQAQKIVSAAVESARSAAEKSRQDQITQAHARDEEFRGANREKIDALVGRIADIVVRTHTDRTGPG